MGKENFSKIKLLKIWEILKKDRDENNPLTTNQIIDGLAARGIVCDCRTLFQDIAELNFYGYEMAFKRGSLATAIIQKFWHFQPNAFIVTLKSQVSYCTKTERSMIKTFEAN